ncbi:HlyD family secretion protein [Mucilaginibacter polytrichastri]|uniref:AprE-like beta-barrel domain-containing protein n=1 Tax=Mucilaginibacter polytrichastri TaxID=1302689 RepID=A0A1Q5ZVW1_9SPHI|nr:HlyD family efflux transporter periplasmic adaptor subunit [Mucilaginibacter polytrichastri]OKS85914.1 hypothetical protein RG47T_1360 [Mucilaginibacter polytrichastri]SFS60601.1 HlyD family secretion protein [Mucilaginibacter polytrichastri]
MILSNDQLVNTEIYYLSPLKRTTFIIYWVILAGLVSGICALPFVHTTIAVTSQGIIRPWKERTEVKAIVGGIIDTLYYREGSFVKKGAVLLKIKDRITAGKRIVNRFQINQHYLFIHDLKLLTSAEPNETLVNELSSPLYKEQLSHYLHQKSDQEATLKKATKELGTNTTLLNEKVITQKEFFDTQVQFDKTNSSYKAFVVEQQTNWQQDLAKYELELSQYKEERNQVNNDASYYDIKAPVSGTLQGINTLYSGGLLQANETLCTISPDGRLLGECYVSTKDIGLIKIGQPVHFQIDAFDYNYFGILTGKVLVIDNDFSMVNNSSLFKVRCQFDQNQLSLKNGFKGALKKGLSFQARFIIGNRTLWQLLWDDIDDWLNPTAPSKK